MEKVKELIENKRILALVGILGNVLGIILPFYTITFFGYTSSAAAIDSWVGIVLLIFVILSGVVIFSDLIKSKFPEVLNNSFGKFIEKVNDPKFGFVPAVIIALFIIYLISKTKDFLNVLDFGIGFYLMCLGVLGFVGHGIFYKGNKKVAVQTMSNEQNMYNNVQTTIISNEPQVNSNNETTNTIENTQSINNQTIQNIEPQPELPHKFCPNCGTKLTGDATSCFMCGKEQKHVN